MGRRASLSVKEFLTETRRRTFTGKILNLVSKRNFFKISTKKKEILNLSPSLSSVNKY